MVRVLVGVPPPHVTVQVPYEVQLDISQSTKNVAQMKYLFCQTYLTIWHNFNSTHYSFKNNVRQVLVSVVFFCIMQPERNLLHSHNNFDYPRERVASQNLLWWVRESVCERERVCECVPHNTAESGLPLFPEGSRSYCRSVVVGWVSTPVKKKNTEPRRGTNNTLRAKHSL